MKMCDEGEDYSFTRYGVLCDSCNRIHMGGDDCGRSKSGICICCGRNVHYVRPAKNVAYWRHNSFRVNTGTGKGNEDDHTRAINKLLDLINEGTSIRIDYSNCPGIQESYLNCEGWKEPFTIHPHEYKFDKEVTLVRQDSYGETMPIRVDLFGTKDEKNPTKSNSLIIEVRHTHEQRRNAIGIPWHEVSATEVNSASVKEDGLTLKAVNVCSSCRFSERSCVMKERIDKVLERMRRPT